MLTDELIRGLESEVETASAPGRFIRSLYTTKGQSVWIRTSRSMLDGQVRPDVRLWLASAPSLCPYVTLRSVMA